MNRKGQETVPLETLVYLFVLLVVLFGLLGYARRVGSEQPFDRLLVAQDRALTIGELSAVTYDGYVRVPALYNFTENYTASRVVISDPQDGGDFETAYYLLTDVVMEQTNLDVHDRSEFITLSKEGSHLSVGSDTASFDSRTLRCSRTTVFPSTNLIVDPQGMYSSGSAADPEDIPLLAALELGADDGAVFTRTTLPVSIVDRRAVVESHEGSAILSVGSMDGKSVRAYVLYDSSHYEASRTLACALLNAMLKGDAQTALGESQIESVSIVPVSKTWMSSDDPLQILDGNRVGVGLSIGTSVDDVPLLLRHFGSAVRTIRFEQGDIRD